MSLRAFQRRRMGLADKLGRMSWGLVLMLVVIGAVGVAMLYSAANGSMTPWAMPQMVRFGVGLAILMGVALVDIRFWHRWTYAIYGVSLALLALVDVMGSIGMGAQRWLDLWIIQLQPSEIAKVALIMALARHFNGVASEGAPSFGAIVVGLLMILVPAALVMKQPDLGTAGMFIISGAVLFFAAGVKLRYFAAAGAAAIAILPIAWQFLHGYQRDRILIYLDPERDPLGAGYHILQSKIALGAGGLAGKGFMAGTQSHLSFLPERQTDFIFTMLAEEFGLIGAAMLIGVYALIVVHGYVIGLRSASHYGRLLAVGLISVFFLYVFINVAMVTGLVPVVGVPLPLVSYGGTSMLTILFGFGLLASVNIHRETPVPRRPGGVAPA